MMYQVYGASRPWYDKVCPLLPPRRVVRMGAPLGSEYMAVLLNQFTGLWPGSNVMFMQQLSSTTDTLQRRLHDKENACKTKPL